MDDTVREEERAYWEREVQRRSQDVEDSRARGDPPYVLAAAVLRLKEANERLMGLQKTDESWPAI